ncbi:MAG: ABC transporter permease [Acidobacteria bacterium]|nr:ABC transporter permease [Acidobacteriota bacterium]MYJ06064.1 ABC transporter permease [Acidobacteriota bacterium]
MHWRRRWKCAFPWLSRGRVDRDLSRELALHVELETRENLEQGMAPEDAARAARVSLGNVPLIREDARAVWGWRWLDAAVRSLTQGFRSFRRTPGFSFVAMGVLAIGIGLNTAIFSVVYGLLMRPLPYPDPDSIVVIHMRDPRTGNTTSGFSWLDLGDWVTRSRSFDGLALSQGNLAALDGDAGYERFDGWTVSGAFFEIFGNPLLIGRGPTDPRLPEAVISHGLWQGRFDSDPAVLDRPITVNGDTYTIVGVARPDFRVPTAVPSASLIAAGAALAAPDVWFPVRPSENRRSRSTHLVGRLRPGVTLAQAQDDAGAVARAIAAEHSPGRSAEPVVTPLPEHASGALRLPLLLLFGAVGMVLLVACANVTALLLARQASRTQELLVRKAIGASRTHLFVESVAGALCLAGVAGLIGVALAHGSAWLVRTTGVLGPVPESAVRVDAPVMVFAVAISIGAALFAGLLAAAPILRSDTGPLGGMTWARGSEGRQARRLRAGVVTAQIAISVVLVVGTALLSRSFARLIGTDLGVATGRVMSVQINLTMGRTLESAERAALTERVIARVAALPPVEAVGAANGLPPNQTRMAFYFEDEAATLGVPREHRLTLLNPTAGYFNALGIPLLRGRFFSARDTADSPPVVILSEAGARRLFGTIDVVGQVLPTTSDRKPAVVGVVGDVRYGGVAAPPPDAIYQPFGQMPFQHMNLVVRTAGNPLDLAGGVRAAVHEVDREITVDSAHLLDDLVAESVATPRFRALLLGSLALLALGLASFGLAGVITYSVARRTPEIAIRMALGARAPAVLALVMREGLLLAVAGVAVGLAGAFVLTRTLESFLYEVAPTDGVSFVAAAGCLLLVAMAAAYLPARRATRVDPMAALRME